MQVVSVPQDTERVWDFLANPLNSHKWDKSIKHATVVTPGAIGVGTVIQTESPAGKEQSFVITEFEAPQTFAFKIQKSSLFKEAELKFVIDSMPMGSKITHIITLTPKPHLFLVVFILALISKRALGADLGYLKEALQKEYST